MVVLIDNLRTTEEERAVYENLFLNIYKAPITDWIDLGVLECFVETEIINLDSEGEKNIKIIIATGGLEVYYPDHWDDYFIFKSQNVSPTNTAMQKISTKKINQILDQPVAHHSEELDRLSSYLSDKKGKPVTIIEGDVGSTGLSASRIAAIYYTVHNDHPTNILIGVAPGIGLFAPVAAAQLEKTSDSCLRQNKEKDYFMHQSMLDCFLSIEYNIIVPTEDSYIRRLSEIAAPQEKSLDGVCLKKDAKLFKGLLKRFGYSNSEADQTLQFYAMVRERAISRRFEMENKMTKYRTSIEYT